MGTDIHMTAERFIDGAWENIPGPLVECWWCNGTGHDRRSTRGACWSCNEHGDSATPGSVQDDWYGDRHYALFWILAEMRYGDHPSISRGHRGIPPGAHPDTIAYLEGRADHSETWLDLTEIEQYPWPTDVDWFDDFHDRMRQLRQIAGPGPVRIVFGFDS